MFEASSMDKELVDDMLKGCVTSSKRKKKQALKKGDLGKYAYYDTREKFCEDLKGDKKKRLK